MEKPGTMTTERAKPKLVIFDDDSVLLDRFTKEYAALGYAVTPVLVGVGVNDNLMQDGLIKQGEAPAVDQDWRSQDRPGIDPVRTVQNELQEAKRANDTTGIAIYSAMRAFTYGVTSKTQVRQLLRQLKPDFVLSDLQMRRFADYDDMTPEQHAADDETIMGTDIMALAKQEMPHAPRAIHSGAWTQEEGLHPNLLAVRKQSHDEAALVAASEGYAVFPKDTWRTAATPASVDAYFKAGSKETGRNTGFSRF